MCDHLYWHPVTFDKCHGDKARLKKTPTHTQWAIPTKHKSSHSSLCSVYRLSHTRTYLKLLFQSSQCMCYSVRWRVYVHACDRERYTKKCWTSSVFWTLPLFLSLHLTGLQRDRGFQINHPKVFTNAQSQTQTSWHMATLFKCFSMCLWCQHLFHTYLHLKGEKRCFCDL